MEGNVQHTEAGMAESILDSSSNGVTEQWDLPISRAPGQLSRDRDT